jgi:hypothetical protein
MDLPIEIQRMILERVIREINLPVKVMPATSTMKIAYPSALTVSRSYLKVAQETAVHQATISATLEGSHSINPGRTLTILPQLHSVQCLTVQDGWGLSYAVTLDNILKSVPRLQNLTLIAPLEIFIEYGFEWETIGDTWLGDVELGESIPAELICDHNYIKKAFEAGLEGCFNPRSFNAECQFAGALDAWLTRNKQCELCVKAQISGTAYIFDEYQDTAWALWVSD